MEFAGLDDGPRRRELRAMLVTGFLPLSRRVAVKFRERGVPVDDLVQVASVGLVNAVDRFDPGLGVPFLGFAIPTIQGEIRRHFRDQTWSMKISRGLKERHLAITKASAVLAARLNRAPKPSEVAAHLGLTTDEVMEGVHAGNAHSNASLDEPVSLVGDTRGTALAELLGEADARLEMVEYRHALRPLLEALPERERMVVMLRFFSEMTQSEIAAEIGISQMHVSRLLSRILSVLRRELEDQ